MIHFVSVEAVTEEDVLFGTCDLCEYYGSLDYDVWVFEDTETGHRYDYQNGSWDWGGFDTHHYIENLVDFGHWFNHSEYANLDWPSIDRDMYTIIESYEESFNDTDRDQ